MTRLVPYSPFGWQFTLGSFLKTAKVAHIFELLYPWSRLCINFAHKMVGLHFGQFFHKLVWDRCYDFRYIYFCRKIWRKQWRLFAQTTASFCKKLIITLVFEKNANFFAENWQKSQKTVIITSTPGHPFLGAKRARNRRPFLHA
jgi:hypothetical protein